MNHLLENYRILALQVQAIGHQVTLRFQRVVDELDIDAIAFEDLPDTLQGVLHSVIFQGQDGEQIVGEDLFDEAQSVQDNQADPRGEQGRDEIPGADGQAEAGPGFEPGTSRL